MGINRYRTILATAMVLVAVVLWQFWRSVHVTDVGVAHRTTDAQTANKRSTSGQRGEAGTESRIIVVDASHGVGAQNDRTSRGASGGESRARQLTSMRDNPSFGAAILQASGASDIASRTLLSELIDFCVRNTTKQAKAAATSNTYVPYRVRVPIVNDSPQVIKDAEVQSRFDANKQTIQDVCRDFDLKAANEAEKLAMEKLTAEQATYIKLLNAFDKGINPKAVTSGQFELIAKALDEKDTGTLLLLGEQLRPGLEKALEGTAAQADVRQPTNFAGSFGMVAWQLALCQLGAECGSDSIWAAQMCFRFGACAGDDLAGSLRAALIRDGVAPDVLDKQASAFLTAIVGGDPTRLGIVRPRKQ